jgi:hypothetical protein
MSSPHLPQRPCARVPALLLITSFVVAACGHSADAPGAAIEPVYSRDTGELMLLRHDANRNGVAELESHMRGARIVRIDVDLDEDGCVDRWEHYGADQRLHKVGFSRAHNCREDAWSTADASGAVVRVEIAAHGTDRVTRTEYYEHAALVRAEEDSDADGTTDRWETYERGRLARLAFDTSHAGVATDVLTYHADGSVEVEALQPHLDRRR